MVTKVIQSITYQCDHQRCSQWTERARDAVQAERVLVAAAADETLRAAREEQDRAVAAAASDATAEAWRKARAEADVELVKLRRAVDTTSLWYEDQLDTARAERDRCTGE